MMEIIQSETFLRWTERLRDRRANALIAARLGRLARGMLGDAVSIGDGVKELRIHYGPGYRLYFIQHGIAVIILLCAGDKGSQKRDIDVAKRLAREWRQNHG